MTQVRVSEGLLEGEVVLNEYGGAYYSFKGIPYAQPPLGDLRFKAPHPPIAWEGIRSAKDFGSMCYQYELFVDSAGKGIRGSEDCLYLNVYTPDVKPDKPLPVMFWIHGGGLISGSGEDDFYGPKFLVKQEVILVTINYRLEVLGFLCLNSDEIPGNAGMKDQVAALRWVNKNIASFGGDPNNITIFGESAGGVSTSYHLISPMSKGLFRRAIVQSGVNICSWGKAYRPRDRAVALARKLGFYSNDDKELYEFFKNQPVELLVQHRVPITFFEKSRASFDIYFNVVDEKQFGDGERFFYGDLSDIVPKGAHKGVDIIIGYTAHEGLLALGINDYNEHLELANNYPQFFVSNPMSLYLPANEQLKLGQRIKNYYFNSIEIRNPDDWENLQRFQAMDMIVYHTIQWAKMCVKVQKNKVYLYKFSIHSELNKQAQALGLGNLIEDKPVVCHADDLGYLFNSEEFNITIDMNSSTFQHIEKVTKLWTNFAKYG